jgi:hypothetical protein
MICCCNIYIHHNVGSERWSTGITAHHEPRPPCGGTTPLIVLYVLTHTGKWALNIQPHPFYQDLSPISVLYMALHFSILSRAADLQILTALDAAIPVWPAAGTSHFQLGSAVSPLPTAGVRTAQAFLAVTTHQTLASLGFAGTASWMLVVCKHNAQLICLKADLYRQYQF